MLIKIIKKVAITIGALAALFIVLLIIGYILDMILHPTLRKISNEALNKLKTEIKTGDGNAWNYYLGAAERIGDYRSSFDLNEYHLGRIELTVSIQKEIKEHQEILHMISEGVVKDYCSIPLDYENGMELKLPNYMRLQTIAKLITANALCDIESGRLSSGLSGMLEGIAFGRHIINGAPILINQMVGIVLFRVCLRALEISIACGKFNELQLKQISDVLVNLENNLPPLSWAYDGELKTMKISMANLPFYKPIESLILNMTEDTPVVGHSFILRIWCWRYLFSTKLASICACRFFEKMSKSLASEEKVFRGKTNEERQTSYHLDEDEVRKYVNQNPIFGILSTNYRAMFTRQREMLTRIRMLVVLSQLWIYHDENGAFPESLQVVNSDYIIEPFTGSVWYYTASKDSAAIASPGVNKNYGDEDDIFIYLKRSSIKDYRIDVKSRKNPTIPATFSGRGVPPRR